MGLYWEPLMKKLLMIFVLGILLNQLSHSCDPKWSYKTFTNQNFFGKDADEFNGKEICASSFYNENPNSNIFPVGMKSVTFIRCNLDNLVISANNTLIDCSTRSFKVQNDLEDWIIDGGNNPIEPFTKQRFIDLGISTNPVNIPMTKLSEAVTITADKNKAKQAQIQALQDEIGALQANP